MVKRDFVAQHFLTVPDSGPENEWHSHHFEVEVLLEGSSLNGNGYLIDIVEVKHHLDRLVGRYRDATLNDLEAFQGLNPSIEHFARIFCHQLQDRLDTAPLDRMRVKIWEDEDAWAAFQVEPAG